MPDNLLTATVPANPDPGQRPAQVPEKFWDAAAGTLRTEALLRSYQELERRLSLLTSAANGAGPGEDRQRLLQALGVPAQPEDYAVRCDHGLFAPDPTLNQRIHAAGFTGDQAQLLYDLAAEYLIPLGQQMAAAFEAEQQLQQLHAHFGGPERWQETARQLLAWGQKNLPAAALEGLSTTAEGILALDRLMRHGDPTPLRGGASASPAQSEDDLRALMRDPRYWRDRNPAIVAQVTAGFQRLYPDQG